MNHKPASIAIAGGSLAGLMTGLELRAAGAQVEILERSQRTPEDRGAGIVMQAETMDLLRRHTRLDEDGAGVRLRHRQYLGADGTVQSREAMPQLMTSWGLLHRALRRAYGESGYQAGTALAGFTADASGASLRLENGGERRVDLLIGADGSRSTVRAQLFPGLAPTYAGYVAWRGVVREAELDPALLAIFADHFTFQNMRNSHALCYLIPGANGETTPGRRRLNWLWYWNVPATELPALMTDGAGRRHEFAVPPGRVAPPSLAAQRRLADQLLAPPFRALWQATREPFLQPILDLAVPRMVAGRVALVGDAAFIPRPHTAASTSKAAANALALGAAWTEHGGDIGAALDAWEPAQLAHGRQLGLHGRRLGERSQFST
jgi:2-polyprenyl-6-methoxyphenol hydroxylase-like FAD-dependent oxidoreductase